MPEKQAENRQMPKTKTSWRPGQSGNLNGRPANVDSVVEKFRNDPRSLQIIDRIFLTALTLGSKNEKKHAMMCAKLVLEKLVPEVKDTAINQSEEMRVKLQKIMDEADAIIRRERLKKEVAG